MKERELALQLRSCIHLDLGGRELRQQAARGGTSIFGAMFRSNPFFNLEVWGPHILARQS